ncbi:hypothetical protein DPMN_008825 [Dreissena polymorpha]|uniref:Uncharacterized protein n=1 Tax=Dreissena polymorpha TaxID=45954 RepID=A0A9D4MWX6_DREPO|nr:hypothetical protein DPMN_008825 [Dreissena polymorpha]
MAQVSLGYHEEEGEACVRGTEPKGRGRVAVPHDDGHEALQLQWKVRELAATFHARSTCL